jgi:hypothetical protein
VGLADELLEDARHLAEKGLKETRESCMRRAVSTAYSAVFHLLVEDFVANWPFADQRARLARMFDHKKMRDAAFTPKDEKNPTPVETALVDVRTAFRQLQADRHRADYDLSWNIVASDVTNACSLLTEGNHSTNSSIGAALIEVLERGGNCQAGTPKAPLAAKLAEVPVNSVAKSPVHTISVPSNATYISDIPSPAAQFQRPAVLPS